MLMRATRSLAVMAAALCVAGCAGPVTTAIMGPPIKPDGPIGVGTGAATASDPYAAGRAAAEKLKEQFLNVAPQAILVSENYERAADKKEVLRGVCSVLPADAVFGMATYGSFGQAGCQAGDSVSLLALGGSGISVSCALATEFGVAKLQMATDETTIKTRLRAAGERLAQQLPRSQEGKLLVLLADAHSPKNQFLVEGVQKVFGPTFPIVGGCANKNAGQTYVYYRGQMFKDSGVALLLSGPFRVGMAGRMAKDNTRVIATAKEAAAEALAKTGGKPLAAMAFDCAGRMGKLKNVGDELAAIQAALGTNLPLFGCYCAGEIGPLDSKEKQAGVLSVGAGWHVMFAILGR